MPADSAKSIRNNAQMLSALGRNLRKQGRLAEATTLYARLTQLLPEDREAPYMQAILAGTELPAPPEGIHPAPFVLLEGLFPPALHETLLIPGALQPGELVPAKVGNNEYKPECRESLEVPGKWEGKARVNECVAEILPSVIKRLQVTTFEVDKIEVKLRVYLDGHFFRLHMDCPANSENANRKVSYVYFFHRQPRAYTGGGLLLFDTDVENNKFTTGTFNAC